MPSAQNSQPEPTGCHVVTTVPTTMPTKRPKPRPLRGPTTIPSRPSSVGGKTAAPGWVTTVLVRIVTEVATPSSVALALSPVVRTVVDVRQTIQT